MNPFIVNKNNQDKEAHPVPCGKCIMCHKRRVNQWTFRLLKQFENCYTAWFITLSYDTDHLPFTKSGQPTLNKRDVQLFFKKLRKTTNDKIKYYVAGEYGENYDRPHYHIILFNAKVEAIQNAWSDEHGKYRGMVYYGDVNEKSIRYTLKYINKPTRIPLFDGDDRQKEFQLTSKGLGADYLTAETIEFHKNSSAEKNFVTLRNGAKLPMPRYYKNKIFDENQLEIIQEKAKKQARFNQAYLEGMSPYDSAKFIHQVHETNKHIERQIAAKHYEYV